MNASYKFIQKLWLLHKKIILKIKSKEEVNKEGNLEEFTNKLIDKITKNLEKFHYNVIIANLYEMYNFLNKEIEKPINHKILNENYSKILNLMAPVIPHFVSECLEELNNNKQQKWPVAEKEFLKEEFCNIVVQINGKKREIIKFKIDVTENEVITKINESKKLSSYLKDKQEIKKIFIPNKLINIIVK